MSELPPVPEGWTPIHSVAYLLLGLASVDGVLDGSEIERILQLMSRYEGVTLEEARESVGLAQAHAMMVHEGAGRDGYFSSLNKHGAYLANRYDQVMLRTVVADLIAIAQSDGRVSEEEVLYINEVAAAWGVGGDA